MSDVKQFTYEELKEHKSRDSLWLTIHKKVYDVTPFLDEVSVRRMGFCRAGHATGKRKGRRASEG